MTALAWDQVGERLYQTGLDRGVLYLPDDVVVPWNGLVSIEETYGQELKSYYLDGVKYLEYQTLNDFSGKLTALTYPDEFESVQGTIELSPGLFLHDQRPVPFGLSYRTLIGNDVDGSDHGYIVHILWNLLAIPDNVSYSTLRDSPELTTFGWMLSALPEVIEGHRPSAHISFRSTDLDDDILQGLEELLYGTDSTAPELPSLSDLLELTESLGARYLIDNGDGTWTASGDNVTVVDGLFTITEVDAIFLDSDTYEVEENEPVD